MVSIDVRSNIRDVERQLSRIQRKQVPFATAKALTLTAKDVQKAETVQLVKKLDRPTKFTQNSIAITPAKKSTLEARVFIRDIQAQYLKYQVKGGTRAGVGGKIGVPTRNKKLNKFGNIAGRRKGLVKGKKQFIATINGISGVWLRTGGKRNKGVKLMVAFESSVNYEKRFPFYKIAQGVVASKFKKNFEKTLMQALATAR
ncbi:MAG TPA: hypothetical protein HPP72_09520 [Gammaproteobacteria bacterium]|jgi:hypothetical protein|nr:hypothetical protein [Gammaproteobacteria bacterium]